MITGRSGSRRLSSARTSSPSIRDILMSRSTACGLAASICLIASGPGAASTAVMPSYSRIRTREARMSASSSTTRTVCFRRDVIEERTLAHRTASGRAVRCSFTGAELLSLLLRNPEEHASNDLSHAHLELHGVSGLQAAHGVLPVRDARDRPVVDAGDDDAGLEPLVCGGRVEVDVGDDHALQVLRLDAHALGDFLAHLRRHALDLDAEASASPDGGGSVSPGESGGCPPRGGRTPSATVAWTVLPPRRMSRSTFSPGFREAMWPRRSSLSLTACPSTLRMTSSSFKPPFSAGPSGTTLSTITPFVSGSLRDSRAASVIPAGTMLMPR